MRGPQIFTFTMVTALAATLAVAQTAPAAGQGRGQRSPEERAKAAAEEQARMMAMPRPVDAVDTVFIEEMTWLEVRDAIKAGKNTVIVTTGGMEQNGPYLATGKHNYVNRATCEAIARKLGNALCAPNVAFVPEGDFDPPTDMMRFPGSISLTEPTFRALLTDIATSLKVNGFQHVILIGDSGGNQAGMKAVAAALTAKWTDGKTKVHFIPEYYRVSGRLQVGRHDLRVEGGAGRPSRRSDDHDDHDDGQSRSRPHQAAHRQGQGVDQRDSPRKRPAVGRVGQEARGLPRWCHRRRHQENVGWNRNQALDVQAAETPRHRENHFLLCVSVSLSARTAERANSGSRRISAEARLHQIS